MNDHLIRILKISRTFFRGESFFKQLIAIRIITANHRRKVLYSSGSKVESNFCLSSNIYYLCFSYLNACKR